MDIGRILFGILSIPGDTSQAGQFCTEAVQTQSTDDSYALNAFHAAGLGFHVNGTSHDSHMPIATHVLYGGCVTGATLHTF